MPEEINQEIEALQQLISMLELAQRHLEQSGESAAHLTNFINDLKNAIESTTAILPQLRQITDAMEFISTGEGISRQRFGPDIGQHRLDQIRDAYQEAQQPVDPLAGPTGPMVDFGTDIESEKIEEFVEQIKQLDNIGLEKLSEAFKELSGRELPVEKIKEFIDNLEKLAAEKEIVNQTNLETQDILELSRALDKLRSGEEDTIYLGPGEIEQPEIDTSDAIDNLKKLKEEVDKLSDIELDVVLEDVEKLVSLPLDPSKFRELGQAIKDLESGKIDPESLGIDPKEFEVGINAFLELVETFPEEVVTAVESIKAIGEEIDKLEDTDLEALSREFEKIAGKKFPVEEIKEFSASLKEIESQDILPDDAVENIVKLKDALQSIGTEDIGELSFESLKADLEGGSKAAGDLKESFKSFYPEVKNVTKAGQEFNLEIRYLRENLGDLGASEEDIRRITNGFIKLQEVDFSKLYLQLKDLDLPDDEVEEFAQSFLQLKRNTKPIFELMDKLSSLGIPKETVETLAKPYETLGTSLASVSARMSGATEDTKKLTIGYTTGAGATRSYGVTLDSLAEKILKIEQAIKRAKPEVTQFAEALEGRGISLDARRSLVTEAFGKEEKGAGATGFTNLRFKELENGVLKVTTSLKIGGRATQEFTRYVTEMGEVLKTVGQTAEKSPLRQFAEGLKAAGAPRQVRRQIIEETSGQGIEGISGTRITELDDGITKLNTTLKLGGDITKAFTIYWDKFGNTMDRLDVKDVTVSIKDFTDQLSGRVGAIESVTKMVDKYGFELSDLKKMSTEASTGLTKLDFSMKSQGGATEKLTLHVTEFGKVLTDTQRRFRTFAGGIIRNVGHSFQWAVAITAVYGPLRKLQDLVEVSIDNETKLADIGVVLGKNTFELQSIFKDSAAAAQATGESLNGVIEGYALAYRATGNIANETERAAVAQQLLIDSLVLSKLSALEQAEAMDTLVAGLLQVGYGLDQGKELLNKWVAVSKAANVSVDTLASSFAIMATAAQGVGLEFDELNAIVAVVAANTELSATQAGNAVRAFVSGFQTKNAREELAKYGIAVEDLNGDARNFMTVMYDIQELMDAGLIDDAELNRIGTMLGGRGARRGAQFTTFLKSLGEVQGLVAVSAEAQADAYDGLAVKMDTVQTSLTNLATSFQVLANAVGTDGGVLELLRGLLSVLGDITEAATSFVGVMGKAAPFLAIGGGLLAYGKYGSQRLGAMPGQFGGLVTSGLGRTGYGQRQDPSAFKIDAGGTGRTMAQAWGTRAQLYAPLLGTLMAQGTLAAFNIADEDWDGLGAQIGGGVFGFLVGGPIGSIIGSVIAESIVNGLQAAGTSGELADAFKGALVVPEDDDDDDDPLSRRERLKEEEKKLNEDLQATLGVDWVAGMKIWDKSLDNFLRDLVGMPRKWKDDLEASTLAGTGAEAVVGAYDAGAGKQEIRDIASEYGVAGFQVFGEGADASIETRIEELRILLDLIEKNVEATEALDKGLEPEGTALDTELTRNMEKYGDLLKDEIILAQDEFNKQLIDGDLTIRQYRESMERMGSEGEAIMQIYSALDDVLGDSAENLLLVLDVISKTSAEEINIITNLTSGIGDLKEQIAEAEAEGDVDLININKDKLDAALFELNAVFTQLKSVQREPLIQFDEPIGLDTRSLEDHRRVVNEAMRLLEEDMQENIRLGLIPDDTTIQEVLATHEKIAVAIAGKYLETMQIPMDYYMQAQENLSIPGKIEPPVSVDKGLQIREVEMSQGAFMAAYERQLQFLKDAFGDLYQGDFSTVGIVFSDGVDVLHLDNLAMQLAMNDLIDVNQKQLEGVYNLPTDSSFYVPFQGYKLGFGEEGGMGGAASDLSGAANELSDAADSIRSLGKDEALQEGWGGSLEEFFGVMPTRPTDFELTYPRYQLPEMLGPPTPEPQLQAFQPELQTYEYKEPFADKFGRSVDSFNQGVDSQMAFWDSLFGTQTVEDITTTTLVAKELVLPEAETTVPIQPPPLEKDIPRRSTIQTGEERGPLELPGAATAEPIVSELQNLSTILVENLFNFSSAIETLRKIFQPFSQGTSEDTQGTSPLGAGPGIITPQLEIAKFAVATTALENIASFLQPQLQPLGPSATFGTGDVATEFIGVLDLLNQKISNLSGFTTNLKISSSYTANLIVDGRVLATIIKPYLYSDLIRFEDSAASVTKTIIV